MKGKVVIVTGASSGIGFAAAKELYNKGAKVYLACRNEEKTLACIKRIEESKSNDSGEAIFLKLDLDDPRGSKASAEKFMELEERLDILINNAALVLADVQFKDEYGIQREVLTNYFSTRIFTESLLPVLKKTDSVAGSDVRIVNISSKGHKMKLFLPDTLQFKTIDDLNLAFADKLSPGLCRYSHTKLMVHLWTLELQARLSNSGSKIIVMAVHPGSVQTEVQDSVTATLPRYLRYIYGLIIKMTYLSVEEGTASMLFAATSADVRREADAYEGAYLEPPGKIATASKQARDPELAREFKALADSKIKEWGISLPE